MTVTTEPVPGVAVARQNLGKIIKAFNTKMSELIRQMKRIIYTTAQKNYELANKEV